jgi:hypothetical protein
MEINTREMHVYVDLYQCCYCLKTATTDTMEQKRCQSEVACLQQLMRAVELIFFQY